MNAYTEFGRAARQPAVSPLDTRPSAHPNLSPRHSPSNPAPEPVEYFWQLINPGWIGAGVSFAVIEYVFELVYYGGSIPGLFGFLSGFTYLLYSLLMLLGSMWVFVLIRGNPYAVRMDEKGIDIPTMYDRVIPWDSIAAIRTQSLLGLFKIVHLTTHRNLGLGCYSSLQLPGGERNQRADTVTVTKAGIPNWMTNGKLKDVLAKTKQFHEYYSGQPF